MRAISEAIAWLSDERYVHCSLFFVSDSMCTLEKVHLGMHYADWKPTITANQLESIVWIFTPGHAGVLVNKRVGVLAGSAEIRDTLIMDLPAVHAAVQEMLTATRA